MGGLSLMLLGGFEVQGSLAQSLAVPTRKAQALLAYLALTPGRAHPRNELATLLWPDVAPGAARNALRQTLFGLRKALPAADSAVLVISGDAVTLSADGVQTDVAAFERAVADGTSASLESATDLYRG